MPEIRIPWTDRLRRIFKRQLRPYLVEGKYKVIPAFSIGGVYAEMEMNCNKEYLETHVKAMDKILSDPKKISMKHIVQLNINLKERLDLMPFPEFIYKLASVIFFDDTESLYSYDYDYNKLKIEKWKAAGGTLDFFSATPLAELVPSLNMPAKDTQTYLTVSKFISETHQALLTETLSES